MLEQYSQLFVVLLFKMGLIFKYCERQLDRDRLGPSLVVGWS